jgi:hypothetical protein
MAARKHCRHGAWPELHLAERSSPPPLQVPTVSSVAPPQPLSLPPGGGRFTRTTTEKMTAMMKRPPPSVALRGGQGVGRARWGRDAGAPRQQHSTPNSCSPLPGPCCPRCCRCMPAGQRIPCRPGRASGTDQYVHFALSTITHHANSSACDINPLVTNTTPQAPPGPPPQPSASPPPFPPPPPLPQPHPHPHPFPHPHPHHRPLPHPPHLMASS